MKKEIEIFKKIRVSISKAISDLNTNELNIIPEGFSNNVVWHLGHLLVTQQSILYRSSKLEAKLDDKYFTLFKSGTIPNKIFSDSEIKEVKELFHTQINNLETDFNNNIFKEYNGWNHGDTGIVVDSIDAALSFNIFHESMHFGAIKLIKKHIETINS